MNEMLNYIFRNLRITENRLNILRRAAKRQKDFNSIVVCYMAVNSLYVYAQKLNIDLLEDTVADLRNDISELKGEKGAK